MDTTKNNTIDLPLAGVESEHCALIVDKGLDKIPGITSHKVELNNHKAVITTSDTEVIPKAVNTIRDLGYDVQTIKQNFAVTGMTCASCAISTETIVKSQPGVVDASVNFSNSSVQVEYVPTVVTPQELKSSVQSIGYDLIIEDSKEATNALEDLHRERLEVLKKRTIWSGILSVPLVIIGMLFMNPASGSAAIPYANYIMWALATPVVLVFGRQFFINAWKQAKHRSANMDTLVALSTGVAYLFSVFNTLYPQFWHSKGLHAHVYFEVAAVVIAFILLGKLLEERAKASTSSAIKKLIGLQPKSVTIVHHGEHMMEIPIEQVKVNDTLLVKPGEKIAVDGYVKNDESYVDESMISGEPLPVLKSTGSKVFAGTINQKGSFQFKAEKVGGETLLAQIIKMVQEAQGSKAPVQKLVDKISLIFVPVVIGIAILAGISWIVFGGENGVTHGILAFVTVLVIACPCALGLATPTAVMVGIGKGADNGILIKDAESLELAHKINAIVLDKTGTITEGKPEVSDIIWSEESAEYKNVLFSIEKSSEHPLAEAVTKYFEKGAINLSISDVQSITGSGISAVYNRKKYFIGNRNLMESNKIAIANNIIDWSIQKTNEAKTVVFFADDQKVLAAIAIADKIKDSSAESISKIQSSGIEVYMLTGDNHQTATAVARQTGIKNYKAEVSPQDKHEFIKDLQAKRKIVGMVGDGINDSQALAQADVSIAMAKGSDIAMDVATMTLMSSDLLKIPAALNLSKKTVRTIKQNLFWAFIYNIIGIPIAAGLLYPFTGFLLNPMIAGAAMALSSVSVVSNSLRLKWASL